MTDHDHGYKRLFSHPEMVRDLLVGFVRQTGSANSISAFRWKNIPPSSSTTG